MVSEWVALGNRKSGCAVDATLRPDSRLAFRRPGRQTHGAHKTPAIIFDDVRDMELKKNVLCPVECLHVAFSVGRFVVYDCDVEPCE